MENISPNTDDFYSYYTSAPTSHRRCNHLDGFYFLSMPTSPMRDPSGANSGSLTPEGFTPYANNFEFEGSKRFFYPYKNAFIDDQNFSIAYADELFFDGKILPLRPPPQAHYIRPNKNRDNGSTSSSPGARGSKLKVPFFRQRSLWNDGFDPFLVALNKVKGENDVKGQHEKKAQLRRSKSLSPSPFRRPNGSTRWDTHKNNKVGLGPNHKVIGPLNPYVFGPIKETKEDIVNAMSLESRKQRIKKFLLKNASFGKEINKEKRELKIQLLLRKQHASHRFGSSNSNAIIRMTREMKSLMKHRAKIFFCLAKGFGIKGTTKMS